MTLIYVPVFLLILFTFVFLHIKNKNLLSPTKIFFVFSFLFYLGYFLSEPNLLSTAAISVLFLTLLVLGFLDLDKDVVINQKYLKSDIPTSKYLLILIFILPGLLLKIFQIYESGSIEIFLYNLAFRVRDLRGEGWKVVLYSSIQGAFLYLMFLYFIDSKKTKVKTIIVFLVLCILLFMGITSGSRTSIALPIVSAFVLYHYLVRNVKRFFIISMGSVTLVFIAVYGAYRDTFGQQEGISFSFKNLDTAQFHYGVNPLNIIYESSKTPLLLGESYLTLLTNFIPRMFFENKPDTGGLVFTKFYMDNQWGGLSNLAPGVFGEGIMNFGFSLGFLFGSLLLFSVLLSSVLIFRKALFYTSSNSSVYKKGFFLTTATFFVFAASRFSYSEFTNVFFSYFLFNFLPLLIIYFLVSIRIRL